MKETTRNDKNIPLKQIYCIEPTRGSTTQTEKALREVSDECRTQDGAHTSKEHAVQDS